MHIDKRRVYGLSVAMNVARFIAFCGKLEYGRSGCIFAYISMTTRARDFKINLLEHQLKGCSWQWSP